MSITFIGSTLRVGPGAPASEDQSGYEAMSLTEVGGIISVGQLGDTAEDVTIDQLKTGRVKHVNGKLDLGEVAFAYDYIRDDAGQIILRANNNTNNVVTVAITDTDGDDHYFQAVVANIQTNERTSSTSKGSTGVFRGQTGVTLVEGT